MKNYTIILLLFLCMVYLGFGKSYKGVGMQMTIDGTGVYYKRLWSLTDNCQLIGDAGVHFDNSQPRIDVFGYDNNYQTIMMDFTTGYRYELFSDKIAGSFRPIFIMGIGGVSDLESFSNNNNIGIWMIKYMLGVGFHFYNGRIMNEVTLHFIHSEAIEGNAAFQLAFYWK